MNSTRHMSLAQFVAHHGGIYYQRGEPDKGELRNIRQHSKKLRGANAVFKKGGHPSDLLCILDLSVATSAAKDGNTERSRMP